MLFHNMYIFGLEIKNFKNGGGGGGGNVARELSEYPTWCRCLDVAGSDKQNDNRNKQRQQQQKNKLPSNQKASGFNPL